MTRKKSSLGERFAKKKTKVIALASAAGILAVSSFAVGPTVASWTSVETAGTSATAGTFVLQVSTNGGTTWTNTGSATVSFNDFSHWSPGDSQSKDFRLRVSPTSTHTGAVNLSSCGTAAASSVRIAGTGGTSDYNWTVVTPEGNVGGTSFTNCSYASTGGTGELVLRPANSAGVPMSVQLTAKSTLTQSQNSTFNITFTAEQLTHTQAAGKP